MANIAPMTLEDILKEVHTFFSNGVDYPVSTEEDYQVRVAIINNIIRTWQSTPGVNWDELYDVKATQTIVAAGDSSWPCSSSYRELGGKVKLILGTKTFEVTMYSQKRLDDNNLGTTYGYVSGKSGAYTLNLVGVPAEWIGATIRYRFYRWAAQLVNPSDVPDMRNPNYLVFSCTSRLFQLAHNNTGYTIYFNDAEAAMDDMKVNNLELEDHEREDPMSHRIQPLGIMGS